MTAELSDAVKRRVERLRRLEAEELRRSLHGERKREAADA